MNSSSNEKPPVTPKPPPSRRPAPTPKPATTPKFPPSSILPPTPKFPPNAHSPHGSCPPSSSRSSHTSLKPTEAQVPSSLPKQNETTAEPDTLSAPTRTTPPTHPAYSSLTPQQNTYFLTHWPFPSGHCGGKQCTHFLSSDYTLWTCLAFSSFGNGVAEVERLKIAAEVITLDFLIDDYLLTIPDEEGNELVYGLCATLESQVSKYVESRIQTPAPGQQPDPAKPAATPSASRPKSAANAIATLLHSLHTRLLASPLGVLVAKSHVRLQYTKMSPNRNKTDDMDMPAYLAFRQQEGGKDLVEKLHYFLVGAMEVGKLSEDAETAEDASNRLPAQMNVDGDDTGALAEAAGEQEESSCQENLTVPALLNEHPPLSSLQSRVQQALSFSHHIEYVTLKHSILTKDLYPIRDHQTNLTCCETEKRGNTPIVSAITIKQGFSNLDAPRAHSALELEVAESERYISARVRDLLQWLDLAEGDVERVAGEVAEAMENRVEMGRAGVQGDVDAYAGTSAGRDADSDVEPTLARAGPAVGETENRCLCLSESENSSSAFCYPDLTPGPVDDTDSSSNAAVKQKSTGQLERGSLEVSTETEVRRHQQRQRDVELALGRTMDWVREMRVLVQGLETRMMGVKEWIVRRSEPYVV